VLHRGTFRVRGETIDVFPAESDAEALRIELFDGEIEKLSLFDPLTGEVLRKMPRFTVYPKTHYATRASACSPRSRRSRPSCCASGWSSCTRQNKLVEAQRLSQRTQFDLEMMAEVGYCNGIENYSRHLTGPRRASRRRRCSITCRRRAAGGRRIARDHSADRRDVQGRPLAQGDAGGVRLPPAVGARQPAAAFRGMGGARAAQRSSCRPRPGRTSCARPAARWSSWWCARPA
jgi:hypothetical protein